MLNTNQLLQLVVDHPNRSNLDLRFLSLIWEAFLRWCRDQFATKVGIKVLGMGEFCYRKDTIGNLEFFNPMFILSESYARAHGLLDRRPKTHSVETESIELDMPAIATLATELVGELIGKDVVDGALRDVIDRIGEVCAEPDKYGIITLDFGFAKLFCENKSLEFMFGDPKRGKDRPDTGASVKSLASLKSAKKSAVGTLPPIPSGAASVAASDTMSIDGNSLMHVPGMAKLKREQALGRANDASGRPADAPLQRPHRPLIKPARYIAKVTREELLKSHDEQIFEKAITEEQRREEENQVYLNTLQRLRKEMTLDQAQQNMRRNMGKVLASHLSEQRLEKRERDVASREVLGTTHWPFRTEEEVQALVQKTNERQKLLLDEQLKEQKKIREREQRELQKQQRAEQELAHVELRLLEAERKGGRQPPTKVTTQSPSVERTMEDAFSRYQNYLQHRKNAVDSSSSFLREQKYLSEQAELLKNEEQRRRATEMRAYLERQMYEKTHAKAEAQLVEKHEDLKRTSVPIPTLPYEGRVDEEEEAHVKLALKQTLDAQVARKEEAKRAAMRGEVEQQQHALNCVALEMQELRARELMQKQEHKEVLNQAWHKQSELKKLEEDVDKATRMSVC
ncbi:hypothetical protein AB1Y20_009737 [Prymnesium parvum]|uniref:CCDC81 HU domain-containing protein n=1 Tax=Prymnesium parvum TaxID=97485 RepID=A0AB34K587_PRYPA|mmetsp:Transcript_27990/g.69534  ORF Transcript_27990/g.69534 Transcript_27990/m.69534 type:complete len:626 (-) Transcript_27990:218-2095(-)